MRYLRVQMDDHVRFSGTKYEKGNNIKCGDHCKCGENIRGRTPRPRTNEHQSLSATPLPSSVHSDWLETWPMSAMNERASSSP